LQKPETCKDRFRGVKINEVHAAFYWARELVFIVNTKRRPVPNCSGELEIS